MEASIGHAVQIGGEAIVRVLRADGSIRYESEPIKNLVLYPGLNLVMSSGFNFHSTIATCRAGTGTTPNSESRDGTYARSGSTVTRSTGTGVFSAGDVGKSIKFGSGEEAYITGYTSTTQVTTRESGAISATSIVVWNTARTALDAQVKSTSTLDVGGSSNSQTVNTGAGTVAYKRTHNFTAEVGTVSYTEVGYAISSGNLFSRIVFGSAVNVNSGEQLQVQYTLTCSLSGYLASTPETLIVTGWPYPYDITGIAHSGTYFDITTSIDHHYSAGNEITISGAIPTKASITAIASTVADFTVTTGTAHGFTGGDSIEIEGCSVVAYNGTWTVASVGSATEYTVTSGANPGAASNGTTRKSTPGTWYNGTWTIASIPSSAVVRVTHATTIIPAGEGDLVGSLAGDARFAGLTPFYHGNNNAVLGGIGDPGVNTNSRDAWLLRVANTPTLTGLGTAVPSSGSISGTRAETCTHNTTNHSLTYALTWDIGQANFSDLKAVVFAGSTTEYCGLVFVFDQNQRKDSGYSLKFGYTVTFRPTLA